MRKSNPDPSSAISDPEIFKLRQRVEELSPRQFKKSYEEVFTDLQNLPTREAYSNILGVVLVCQMEEGQRRDIRSGKTDIKGNRIKKTDHAIGLEYARERKKLQGLMEQLCKHPLVATVDKHSLCKAVTLYWPNEFYCRHGLRKDCVTRRRLLEQHEEIQREIDGWGGEKGGSSPYRRSRRRRLEELRQELRKVNVDPVKGTPESFCDDPVIVEDLQVRPHPDDDPIEIPKAKAGAPNKLLNATLLTAVSQNLASEQPASKRKMATIAARLRLFCFPGHENESPEQLKKSEGNLSETFRIQLTQSARRK